MSLGGQREGRSPPACFLTPTPVPPTGRLHADRVGQILCSISGIVRVSRFSRGFPSRAFLSRPSRFLFEYLSVFSSLRRCKHPRWLPLTVLYVWSLLSLVHWSPCTHRYTWSILQQVVGFAEMAFVGQKPLTLSCTQSRQLRVLYDALCRLYKENIRSASLTEHHNSMRYDNLQRTARF